MRTFCSAALLLLAVCIGSQGADRISANITVTNAAVAGEQLIVNASTRTWAGSWSSTTIATNATIGGTATNLFLHIGAYPFSGIVAAMTSTNVVRLTGLPGASVTVTMATNWAEITYTTNSVSTAQVIRVPMDVEASASRTNMASQLIRDLEDYSPTAFDTGTTLLGNYVDKSTAQVITGSKTLLSVTTSNLVNVGAAVSSPGSGTDSEEFGTGATATGTNALAVGKTAVAASLSSIAIGNGAEASGLDSTMAIGTSAFADGLNATAIGIASEASDTNAIALGNGAIAAASGAMALGSSAQAAGVGSLAIGDLSQANGNGVALGASAAANNADGIAIGPSAEANYTNSIAIGPGVATTAINQVIIGLSGQAVSIPGNITAGSITNTTYYGTPQLTGGTLTTPTLLGGTISNITSVGYQSIKEARLPENLHTTLANGANSGVILTNTFTRIDAGPTGAFSIAGIAGGADGRTVILYNATGQNMTLSHQSGTEATAANRIITMTGADVATTGNGSAFLVYDSDASRWILLFTSP